MGTINKGILGGFSGTVGTVVGGTWKGIDYMRSKTNRRNFNPSQKQLEQQLKFALVMRFVQPMAGLLNISFRDFAIKMTGINNAFAYTINNAITGVYPTYAIDYTGIGEQGRFAQRTRAVGNIGRRKPCNLQLDRQFRCR